MSVVLVVDDDQAFREYVGALLEAEGHDVRLAADGHDALRSVEESRPDCVVLDARMPGLSGYDVLAEIRQVDGGPQLPVVMVTTAAGEAQRWEAWTGGVDFFLAKPIDAEHLVRVLNYLAPESCDD